MTNKVQVKCSSCGQQHEADVWSSINTAQEPELKAKVRSGEVFMWECPHCGKMNLNVYPLLYHDPDARVMVWLLPEGSVPEDRINALSGQLEGLDGYVLRRVRDAGSLIEKINIFEAGLDDRAVEMAKYVTKMELAEKLPEDGRDELMSSPFKFYRMEGADNEIALTYPKDGKMEGVNIGFNVYEDSRGIIGRNPAITTVKGFARVDQDWILSFMK